MRHTIRIVACVLLVAVPGYASYGISSKRGTASKAKVSSAPALLDVLRKEADLSTAEALVLRGLASIAQSGQETPEDLRLRTKYRPQSREEAVANLKVWARSKPKDPTRMSEWRLIVKHEERIRRLLTSDALPVKVDRFLPGLPGEPPVRFGQGAKGLTFLVTRVYLDTSYNTLRTSSNSRAAEVVTSTVLPSLRGISQAFNGADIRFYGMIVCYGSSDFSDEYGLSYSPEAVVLVVSVANCRRFVDGLISDRQLLRLSDVYVRDRDMTAGIKKVEVEPQ
jgi:hypothetical protein